MADEKTTPTPKVEGAAADTMHSTPAVPDRSKGEGADAPSRAKVDPPSNKGSVGSERPRQRIIKTENSGTLVEDLRPNDEGPGDDTDESITNRPMAAPEGPVALQPNEPLDTKPSRGKASSKKKEK